MPAPLQRLQRADKLSLGGGRLCLWAPEFPRWADRPGFWDHAAYLEHAVEPLFTVTLLDEAGLPLALHLVARDWTPARLAQTYEARAEEADPDAFPASRVSPEAALRVHEAKALSPEDVFLSALTLTNLAPRPQRLTLVLWTAQPRGAEAEGAGLALSTAEGGVPERFVFTRHLPGGGVASRQALAFALGAERAPDSMAVNHSEWSTGRANHPRWELTPFFESARPAGGHVRLPNCYRPIGGPREDADHSLLYLALAYPLELGAEAEATLTFGCALAPDEAEARANLSTALSPSAGAPRPGRTEAVLRCERAWEDFFAALPEFHCSDPYLEKYFYYRCFGLRLNAVDAGGRFNLPKPCVFEGVNTGWFRHHISYSAQAHMREARWLHDPRLAQGALENFVHGQRPDGSFPGAIITGPGAAIAEGLIYHADWGASLRALHAVHPDADFLRRVYPALVRYAEYYKRAHDREAMHLYDIHNQAETGQEYMARYQFVDPRADHWGPFQLKGVDPTVYAYNLFRCLEWLAPQVGARLPAPLAQEAEHIARAVRERMWDPEAGFFFDVDPRTGRRGTSKAAVGFYPFLTDIPGPEHLRAFDHLFNPGEFWTPCPLPATSLDDPSFSAEGEWKERRHVCPWNGRAWLMTTAHVAQALAQTAQRFDSPALAAHAAELIRRFVHALFLDHDLARPTSFEYYNPLTGAAPFFRATDDYMHSWVADLIVQFVAGVQPGEGEALVVHPLPFDLEHFSLERVRVKGQSLSVTWAREAGLTVSVNGRVRARRPQLGRVEIRMG